MTDTPEALAEQWADPEFWKLCEAKGASSEQVAESARGVIRALLTEIAEAETELNVMRRMQAVFKDDEVAKLEARLAEAEKERDDWQDHFAHADQERQAAEADRDRYMEKSETLRVLYDKTCDDADRYKAALGMLWTHYLLPITDEQKAMVLDALNPRPTSIRAHIDGEEPS